eukprot:scaffold2655_cov179-Amphora_coffeaeformis.AAC.8
MRTAINAEHNGVRYIFETQDTVPDSLVISHSPSPRMKEMYSFARVSDMLRDGPFTRDDTLSNDFVCHTSWPQSNFIISPLSDVCLSMTQSSVELWTLITSTT